MGQVGGTRQATNTAGQDQPKPLKTSFGPRLRTSFGVRLRNISESPLRMFEYFFGVIGGGWIIVEIIDFISKSWIPESKHWIVILVVVIAAFCYVILRALPPLHKSRYFENENLRIELKVGDLLDLKPPRHVAVLSSDYFDSVLEEVISPHSLKGQIIERFFNGDSREFDKAVDTSLRSSPVQGQVNPAKKLGANRIVQFPIGTLASVPVREHKALLVVGAYLDIITTLSSTTAESLWASLLALWDGGRRKLDQQPFAIPLWGAGLGNAPGNRQVLFELILCSLAVACATRGGAPTTDLMIVIRPQDYEPAEFHRMVEILKRFTI